ncbi:MAG: NAD(P)H-dependent glycerol-3-phosphate dehydrogenase [Nereida ignava]
MTITILGSGAFGTALAITLATNDDIILVARDAKTAAQIDADRENKRRLPGYKLPPNVTVTDKLTGEGAVLIATPTQQLSAILLQEQTALQNRPLIACCKGVDLKSGLGPVGLMQKADLGGPIGILSGPSFAKDIAAGLPTALTLAMSDDGTNLQNALSTPTLRLYLTDDWRGVELGGALKNVIAIACGVAIGSGLGESARAAILTRGFSEMRTYAEALGARTDTLMGLSGLGDLTLTASSETSRNFRYGLGIGAGNTWTSEETVEGAATAKAMASLNHGKMPIIETVAALVDKQITVQDAVKSLLNRPLKKES